MATVNIGLKVSRAISGGETVAAGAYVMATYALTSAPNNMSGTTAGYMPITRYFGPGQSIPSTFSEIIGVQFNPGGNTTSAGTWTLRSGVELINTL